MDKTKIIALFDELLADYKSAEHAVISEYGSRISDELTELDRDISERRREFIDALEITEDDYELHRQIADLIEFKNGYESPKDDLHRLHLGFRQHSDLILRLQQRVAKLEKAVRCDYKAR